MTPMRGRRRPLLALGLFALVIACLWGQVDAAGPLRPVTTDCRAAVQLGGHLVCDEAGRAVLRTLCPAAAPGDGDAVVLGDGCVVGRMVGDELVALGVQIDVNSASTAELEALPGIGPTLAQRIVEARPYRSVAELTRVSGIGVARLAGMRGHVRAIIPEPRRAVP